MKIPLYLNNKKIVLSAEPTESLLSVLRKEKLYSVKCGCQKGMCGNCMILLNDKSAASCLIPVGIARDCHIVTLEYFQSNPCYQDIIAGFSKADFYSIHYFKNLLSPDFVSNIISNKKFGLMLHRFFNTDKWNSLRSRRKTRKRGKKFKCQKVKLYLFQKLYPMFFIT